MTEEHSETRIEAKIKELAKDFKSRFPEGRKIAFSERNTVVSPSADSSQFDNPLNLKPEILTEVRVYNQTLENVKRGIRELEKEGIKTKRPVDFYAEMAKTDEHMATLQSKLNAKKKEILESKEKLVAKVQRKSAKRLKHSQNLEASKEKKRNVSAIEEWKKELRTKKDKARDLSEFINKENKGGKGGKGGKGSKGGKGGKSKGGPSPFAKKPNRTRKIGKKSFHKKH